MTHREKAIRRRQILDLLAGGAKATNLATEFGLTVAYIEIIQRKSTANIMTMGEKATRRNIIINRLYIGEASKVLAEEFNLTIAYIESLRRNFGIKRPVVEKKVRDRRATVVKPATLKILGELLKGENITTIAKTYGLSRQRVQQIRVDAVAAGIPFSRKGISERASTLKILGDLLKGKNTADIAKTYGLSQQRVQQIRIDSISAGMPIPNSEKELL